MRAMHRTNVSEAVTFKCLSKKGMIMQHRPRVSIGLPVYNGENFLADAIDSVLAQTFTDFELVISDNASTDRTESICRAYTAQDARIRYYRVDQNKGAAWNYNRVFQLSAGDYFRWLAHDDKLAPDLLQKSVQVLDAHPDVVLCSTWVVDIDENDEALITKQTTVDYRVGRASKRFWNLSEVRPDYLCEEVFGLIRADVLGQTKLIDYYTDSDRTLLAHLGLFGPFYEIPEPLFFHRMHSHSSVRVNPDRHERMLWFDPSLKGRLFFPHWLQLKELFVVVGQSPVDLKERLMCYLYVLRWAKRRRRYLKGDLRWAVEQVGWAK